MCAHMTLNSGKVPGSVLAAREVPGDLVTFSHVEPRTVGHQGCDMIGLNDTHPAVKNKSEEGNYPEIMELEYKEDT